MKNLLLIAMLLAATGVAGAGEKGAEKLNSKSKSAKQNHGRFLQSHSKQVGGFGPYQVHSLRIRGLDSPNVTAAVIYDPRSETYTVVGPATGAGLGSAILGAAGNVGSSAVFGLSLRPNKHEENINNSSESEGSSARSTSEGGSALAGAYAEGGDGTAVSVSDADSSSTATSSSTSTASRKNGNGPKDKKPKKN